MRDRRLIARVFPRLSANVHIRWVSWSTPAGSAPPAIDDDHIDQAYDRLLTGDVRFRFLIDISTMARG